MTSESTKATVTVPPSLERGDTVAIVAPSRPPSQPQLSIARGRLEALGVETTLLPTAERDRESATEPAPPADRAAEIEAAFRDPEIGAVVAYTGGDDQIRLLSHLDGDVLAEHPTRFFGYSDNDNLRLFLWTHGIASYGLQLYPDLAADPEVHEYTGRYLRRALFDRSLGTVEPSRQWTEEWYDFEDGGEREWRDNPGPEIWRGPDAEEGTVSGENTSDDVVSGRTWGGCFTILKWQLQADRYLPDPERLDGALLAVETSEDVPTPREVGYTLRSMGERGLIERFDGVLVGRPRTQNPQPGEWEPSRESYPEALRSEITRELERYNPSAVAAFGLDFGHTDPSFPFPLGARATLRSDGTLRFDSD